VVIAGAVTVTAGSLAMPLFPCFFAITILQALTGVAGSVFAPALAAITLGLGGTRFFSRRVGRNERAALSNIVAGWIVVVAGYDVAFILLGVLAGAGLAL
jgi:hypothetical protein